MSVEREIYVVIEENGVEETKVRITEEMFAQIDVDSRPVIAKNISKGMEVEFNNLWDVAGFIGTVQGVSDDIVYNTIKKVIGTNIVRYGFTWDYGQKTQRRGRGGSRVMCIEKGEIFDSIRQAEEAVGLQPKSRIGEACDATARGEEQTCGGYHWKWVD